MELEFLQCRDGLYAVDRTLIESIIRSNLYATALLRFSREEVTEKWFGPDIHHWTVDWDKVRSEKKQAPEFTKELLLQAQCGGMEARIRDLTNMIFATKKAKEQWGKKMHAAQEKTMANIATSVNRGEIAVEVAKSIRDVSGGIVVAGATVLSGGSALGLLGTAALSGSINGATKFQDTGSGAAASFAFATGFTVSLIPGAGVGAQTSEKVALFILKTKTEAVFAGGQALVEGKTVHEAVAKSLESVVTSSLGAGAGKLLQTQAARKMLSKIAYPATMKVNFKGKTYLDGLRRTKDFTHSSINTITGEVNKRGVESVGNTIRTSAVRPRRPQRSRPILESALIVDEMLLNRAVQGPDKSEFRSLFRI